MTSYRNYSTIDIEEKNAAKEEKERNKKEYFFL